MNVFIYIISNICNTYISDIYVHTCSRKTAITKMCTLKMFKTCYTWPSRKIPVNCKTPVYTHALTMLDISQFFEFCWSGWEYYYFNLPDISLINDVEHICCYYLTAFLFYMIAVYLFCPSLCSFFWVVSYSSWSQLNFNIFLLNIWSRNNFYSVNMN